MRGKMPNVIELIQNAMPELSKSERRIAEYLLRYPHDIRRFPCDSIANSCNTSRSAVIRFCKKLGYQGYSELRYAFQTQPGVASIESPTHGKTSLDHYADCIQELRNTISPEKISEIAELIFHANRVVIFGLDHSFLSAQQMAFRLNRIHIDSHPIADSSIMGNYANILKQGDLILIFSISGRKDYLEYVPLYLKNRADIALFTMTPQSPLAKYVKHVVALPFASHYSGVYLMDDAITFFLLIEMLIEAVCKKLALVNKPPATD